MTDNNPNANEPELPNTAPDGEPTSKDVSGAISTTLTSALDYQSRGFSIVPQRAGEKHPCVRWKEYQQQQPTQEQVMKWFTNEFPDAGVAVVLGPVSNLFVIDVDGPEAHAELIARLGAEPVAPKVLSGSGKPSRYHLFFRHPAVATRAKITPWHPNLEFRGHRGIVVLPPSLHRSGSRYTWAPGQSLDDIALPDVPVAVLEALSERAARDAARAEQTVAGSVVAPDELTGVQARARAYLAQLPPAIEGQGGDKQTFTAACHLVIGFGLSVAEALPLMREYNERCQPPWTEEGLLSKLQEAEKRPGTRGSLLGSTGQNEASAQAETAANTSEQPLAGEAFVGAVPDFVMADWLKAQPRWDATNAEGDRQVGRHPVGSGAPIWAVHLAVITQRSARVILPDVLLGQVFWGGNRNQWPANWRQRLLDHLERFTSVKYPPFTEAGLAKGKDAAACPELCPLHGSGTRHGHFSVLIRTEHDLVDADRLDDDNQPSEDAWLYTVFLGVLDLFGFDTTHGERVYDFTLQSQRAELDEKAFQELVGRVNAFRKQGRRVSVYFPLRLFGGSPRLGLSYRQRQLMLAIHRELTRAQKSSRPDKAHVLVAGKPGTGADQVIDHYPGLQQGQRYVGFNGNGGKRREQYRGRGYRIVGEKGWLFRARYVQLDETANAWPHVRALLKDLRAVGEMFGLVVAARHMRTGEWLGLDDLLEQTRTASGRKWLRKCALRVYTTDDYLVRWRRVIAERMGFSVIPERDQERRANTDPSASPVQLTAYLHRAGVSHKELARELGITKSLLSHYLNGRKTWTAKWRERLQAWIAEREAREAR